MTDGGRWKKARIKKLAENIAEGKNFGESALAAGFGNNLQAARVAAWRATRSEDGKKALLKALERAGVSDDGIAGVIAKGLKAKKTDKEDHVVRERFVRLACNLRGDIREEQSSGPTNILVLLDGIADEMERRGVIEGVVENEAHQADMGVPTREAAPEQGGGDI